MADEDVELDLDAVDVDFDDDWAEEDAKTTPRRIRVFSETVEIPRVMPALLVLFAYRARTGGDDTKRDMKPDEIVRMVGVLVGQDRAKGYLDRGIGFERLTDLLFRTMKLYRSRDSEGEAKAPAAAETETGGSGSSSSTGASSSPTGAVNTTAPTSSLTSVPA